MNHPNPSSLTPAQSKAWAQRMADWMHYCRVCEARGVDRSNPSPFLMRGELKTAWRRFTASDKAYHDAMLMNWDNRWESLPE
jgi:hypothetical protein